MGYALGIDGIIAFDDRICKLILKDLFKRFIQKQMSWTILTILEKSYK